MIFDQRSRLLGFAKETHIVQQSVGVVTLRRKLYGKYCPEYVFLKIQKLEGKIILRDRGFLNEKYLNGIVHLLCEKTFGLLQHATLGKKKGN